MVKAKETRAAIVAKGIVWEERPFREAVAEEEQAAATRVAVMFEETDNACWDRIAVALRE